MSEPTDTPLHAANDIVEFFRKGGFANGYVQDRIFKLVDECVRQRDEAMAGFNRHTDRILTLIKKLHELQAGHQVLAENYAAQLSENRTLNNKLRALTPAAAAMLDRYLALVNSGDAGNWNPEKEPEVIALRSALESVA